MNCSLLAVKYFATFIEPMKFCWEIAIVVQLEKEKVTTTISDILVVGHCSKFNMEVSRESEFLTM